MADTSTIPPLHAYGYEAIEDVVPVAEFHRASCTLCDWQSEEFGELDWKGAEEAAVAHLEEDHADEDDEDDDDD